MDTEKRQLAAGLLFAIGIGVALAVSLDNIAIGIGVGVLFGLAFRSRNQKKIDDQP